MYLLSIHRLQRARMAALQPAADVDLHTGAAKAVPDRDAPAAGGGPGGSSKGGGGPGSAAKDGNKRRCQELITKPMEFCRAQEGFVVQGDSLLNNFKGIDFTLATWVFVSKKATVKHNFITGKVSHHDAWPLVALRMDGKLDIVYGHSNEFECMTSVATLPLDVWTHVAVVVEQKKIKLFVNGALDAQAGTKGNARAVMYPIVVGSCPPGLRTHVDHVRVGFDGILAQYRYYTRALSPIHIRVVYDQGPPEAYDVRERWIFKLLASLRLLLDSKHHVAPPSMQSAADRLMTLFITDSTRRVRCGAIRLLERILALDAISDLGLAGHRVPPAQPAAPALSPLGAVSRQPSASSINTAAPSPAAAAAVADPVVRMSACTTLSLPEHAPFRERVTLYFIRVIGACWSPALAATGAAAGVGGAADAAAAGGGGGSAPAATGNNNGGSNNNNNNDDSNNDGADAAAAAGEGLGLAAAAADSGSLAAGRAQLLEFLSYTPGILCENISGAAGASPAGGGGGGAAPPLFGDRAASPRSLILGEMSFHLVSLLRSISSVSNWGYAISAVTMNVLNKVRVMVDTRTAWTATLAVEALGAAVLLGESYGGPYLGATASSYFGDSACRVLSVNRVLNHAVVLSWNAAASRRQLSTVRLTELSGFALPFTLELKHALLMGIIDLLDTLQGTHGNPSPLLLPFCHHRMPLPRPRSLLTLPRSSPVLQSSSQASRTSRSATCWQCTAPSTTSRATPCSAPCAPSSCSSTTSCCAAWPAPSPRST